MNDEMFTELVESVKQGGAILRGEDKPTRTFEVPNVRQIRTQLNLSQSRFASLLGISVDTVQNWEQGRRTPDGPARVLLQVAAKHPEAVWDVVELTPEQANSKQKQRVIRLRKDAGTEND